VTLTHWGFAVFGGLCALEFIAAKSSAKPFIPLLTLLPQVAWVAFVVIRARHANVVRWG
jgi:UDP-GlcNAc:undecaprenyl-phosphate GlcNAc-1-phosphate transferase